MRPIPPIAKTVTIDFETYWSSDFTLSKMSMSEYVRDPRFKVHCCAIKIGHGKTKVIWGHGQVKDALQRIDWTTHGLLCQNTLFDGFIMSEIYDIVPCFYFDTKSMAAGLLNGVVSNSLESLAPIYGVGTKEAQSLYDTKGMLDILAEHRPGMTKYNMEDADQCFGIFLKQLEDFPVDELYVVDLVIRMFCDSILTIDEERARTALADELLQRRHAILQAAKIIKKEFKDEDPESVLVSNDKFAVVLGRYCEVPTKISKTTGKIAWALSQTDEAFLELQDSENKEVALLVRSRLAAKSSQAETRAYRIIEAGKDGQRLPVGYTYSAAKTHRFGGTNKLNLQNLERGGELRKSILAPPGHVMVVVDSAQIEARVNAWLNGQENILTLFRNGEDVYKAMASMIYGVPLDQVTKDQRFIGKIAVLGLGYGMGHIKFQTTLALGTMGPPVAMPLGECRRIVNLYRGTNNQIVLGWSEASSVLNQMLCKNEGQAFSGLISYSPSSIMLPGGLPIHYPRLRRSESGDIYYSTLKGRGKFAKEIPQKIYGGKFIENLVQALARQIVIGEQMLKIENYLSSLKIKKNEYARIVMTTHDEVVGVVPERLAEKALKQMIKIMRTEPAWALGLPLDADGGYAREYSK